MAEQDHKPTQTTELITSGPIVKAVLTLATPVVFAMLTQVALSVTDFYWVGHLGAAAQDAVTSSMIMIWTVYATASIISIGVTALVARYVGARNPTRAAHYVRQAIWLATLMGAVVSVIGYALSSNLLGLMKTGAASQIHAVPYLRVFFASCLLLYWMETIYAVFRASGDTKTPTQVGVAIVIINIILDPILIFGLGPIPALGVPGAALATAIAYVSGTVAISRFLYSGRLGYRIGKVLSTKPAAGSLAKITRIGLPIGSQQMVFVMVYWFLIGFVHEFGEKAGAAMGIGNRMESFSYLTCYGFSIAASTLVGQNLGAGKPDRAARCAWGATSLGLGLTLIFSVAFIGFPELIAGLFTDDPRVMTIAVDYLIILGLSQTAMAFEIILEGAFSGAGDTIPPMVVMLPASLARIPLAWYLAFSLGWGINGIWWTLTITTGFKAIWIALWFARGNWKRKKL
jgi:putative MATE family efflux protein